MKILFIIIIIVVVDVIIIILSGYLYHWQPIQIK